MLKEMTRRENEMKKTFEENAAIMLQEQAKRERANYLEQLQKMQQESKVQAKNLQ